MASHSTWDGLRLPRLAGAAWAAALGLGLAVGGAAAQGTELQVQFPMSGFATLQRLDIGDVDQTQFGPVFSAGRLSNGTLLPDVALTVSGSRNYAVHLPAGCTADFCYPAESIQGNGAWQASARAGFGSLGVAASATVGGRTTVGLHYFGPGVVGLGASAVASYTDSLSFESAARPAGSPVSFSVYSVVHASLVNAATVELQMGLLSSLSVTYAPTVLRPATGQQFELSPHVWHTTGGGEQWQGVLASYEVQQGDIVSLRVTMDGRADGVLEEDGPVWPDHGAVAFADAASVSAMYSLATGITVTTPGVTLGTASGHDYVLSAVPEPATLVSMLSGLLAVGAFVARRRSQPASVQPGD